MASNWRWNVFEQGWYGTDMRLASRWLVDAPGPDYWFGKIEPGDTWIVFRRQIIGGQIQLRQITGSALKDEVYELGEPD